MDKDVPQSIPGSIIQNRYKIDRFLDQGANGQVYIVRDMSDPNANLVIKLSKCYKEFALEIKIMKRIKKHSTKGSLYTDVVAYGMALQKDTIMAYLIMPRYGYNLDVLFHKTKYQLSKSSIYDIGLAVLNNLEACHNSG